MLYYVVFHFWQENSSTDHARGRPVGRSLSPSFNWIATRTRQTRQTTIFHHRRQTKWATFNMNGPRTAHKRRCLEIDLLRYDIDILWVQELHMRGTGRMDFGKQHTLLYSSSENSSHHSVGIIMKNELLPRLQWYRCVSDHVASCLLRQLGTAQTQTS